MVNRPEGMGGLRHVALFVKAFDETIQFYTHLLGMEVEWQPDESNVYLTSGVDNLAIHRMSGDKTLDITAQRLDHIGFIIKTPEAVDQWYEFLKENKVVLKTKPKDHRDGARSFYCEDPDGTLVQMIWHPPIA